jgi:hypothetical protein
MLILLLVSADFFWLFNFSSLPLSNPELVKLSGHDGLLDLMPYYSAQEAFTAITNYGAAGRKLYLRFLAADFVFIPIYSLAFALLMTRIIHAVSGKVGSRLPLNLLPFGIGLFDCAENLFIFGMLLVYPDNSAIFGTLSGMATSCKYLLTLTAVLCLAYGGVVLLTRRLSFRCCRVQRQ